jgi:hypothetical protein
MRRNVVEAVRLAKARAGTWQALAESLGTHRDQPPKWGKTGLPRADQLRPLADLAGRSLDWMLGRDTRPEWPTVNDRPLDQTLRDYLARELLARGVRETAVRQLLPDAARLLAEIADDYDRAIDRFDVREIERGRKRSARVVGPMLGTPGLSPPQRATLEAMFRDLILKLPKDSIPATVVPGADSQLGPMADQLRDAKVLAPSAQHEHSAEVVERFTASRRVHRRR